MKSAYQFIGMLVALTPMAVSAQETSPNAMTLAQAQDRCMTTIAVRESRTQTDNGLIFEHAVEACRELNDQLYAAIRAEYPQEPSVEIISMLDEQAEPNFLTLLERIRSDRAARSAQQ